MLQLRMRRRRECYDRYGYIIHGQHYWGAWEILDSFVKPEKVESTLKFWRELNAYAVSQRGTENTLCEYEIISKE